MTAPTVPLSPECKMGDQLDQDEIHGWCRSAEDVLLPDARPYEPPVRKASCACSCHWPADA